MYIIESPIHVMSHARSSYTGLVMQKLNHLHLFSARTIAFQALHVTNRLFLQANAGGLVFYEFLQPVVLDHQKIKQSFPISSNYYFVGL
jgi:hypothetical protein